MQSNAGRATPDDDEEDGTRGRRRLSRPARHLLAGLLQPDPAKRMTLADVAKHQWMASVVVGGEEEQQQEE